MRDALTIREYNAGGEPFEQDPLLAGGLVGALVGAGIPEVEAKRYAGRIREGGYLISVHGDDKAWARKAEEIMEATGGRDVVYTSEAKTDYRL